MIYSFKMASKSFKEAYQRSSDDSHLDMKAFDFVFMFNKSIGSSKVFYFMIDPWMNNRLFPKCNVMRFGKLRNLVHFKALELDGYLYIIGGKDWETGEHRDHTWRYDPGSAKWTERAMMNVARCRHTADVLNGCIYVTGGEVHHGKVSDSCEKYDPIKDKWVEVEPIPRPRADHAACANGGNLYVSGGISNLKHQCSNVFWMYDPVMNEWTEPVLGVILPHEREKHCMVPVGKKVFVIGGRGFDQETFSEKDEAAICSFNTKCRGDFRRDACWDVNHPNMNQPRTNGGAVLLGHNIYMIGGKSFQRDCDVLSVECYNTKKRKSREMFTLPSCDNYVNCDCVTLKVPITNKDINFNDVLLFDKWIMW